MDDLVDDLLAQQELNGEEMTVYRALRKYLSKGTTSRNHWTLHQAEVMRKSLLELAGLRSLQKRKRKETP